ncbi:hypothetical protein B0H13DRAFT_1915563 [Mycena leptocephala]|nr:hypothetical protein B0H13DRAFT_1915563 [Mycena leptocephala]
MDDFLTNSSGNIVEPIWSKRGDTWFGSFGATPDAIPQEALKFKSLVPYLLRNNTSSDVLAALDYSRCPVWYNPEEHWLPWIPLGGPDWSNGDDPLAYLFDVRPVPTRSNYTLMYGTGSDSDDPMEPKEVYAGCFIEEDWQMIAKFSAEVLHGICSSLAVNTEWYKSNRWTGATGDVPRKIEETTITMVYSSEERARKAGEAIKQSTLSLVGFLAWFQTLIRLEDTALHKEDRDYVRSLHLNDRSKTGVLYNISRDFHESNFPHLLRHRVPIHFTWTDEEKKDRATKVLGSEIVLADLPSRASWKEEWDRSDWYFQNRSAGKREDIVTGFRPNWSYVIVDFHLWGTRPLRNPKHIRAYAERFKAALTTTDRGTICTFFRQNPLGVDEPPFDRMHPEPHVYQLENFSSIEDTDAVDEEDVFREGTPVVREQQKNINAPRPSCTFNSFNGACELASLDKSLRGSTGKIPSGKRQRERVEGLGSSSASSYGEAWSTSPLKERLGPMAPRSSRPSSRSAPQTEGSRELGITTDWARKMAGQGRRSSRSNSPRRQASKSLRRRSRSLTSERAPDADRGREGFAEEYAAASASEEGEVGGTPPSMLLEVTTRDSGDHPFSGPSAVHTWEPGFQTEEEARDAIEAWALSVVELTPVYGSYPGLVWNREWLSNAVLVCDDKRSYWRLKAYAAVFKGFTKFEEILEIAIRMALPFAIYIRRSDVRLFSDPNVSLLDLKTLSAIYALGYVDLPLVWSGPGGGPAVYGQYEGRVGALLKRPESIAFVPLGGVCRFVSEVYDESIVYRFARGPSLQVTEFDGGEARRIDRFGSSAFYTTDRVWNSKIHLLLGHIAGSDAGNDRTLWPTPEVFDHLILANLHHDIIERKRYKWRTYSQWKEYFRVGSKKEHQPKTIPEAKDFEVGAEMIRCAFPINWLDMDIGSIVLPEEFDPHAQRD